MTINSWELMIPLAFFAATGVRVANELGSGNGKAAKFATAVAVITSTIVGLFFCVVIMIFHDKFAYLFTSSLPVFQEVDKLSWLLAVTILLNSVQPVLSGVAVGSGWQSYVAYINIGCYYVIGLPIGIIMGWVFNAGVMVFFRVILLQKAVEKTYWKGMLIFLWASTCVRRRSYDYGHFRGPYEF